MCPKRLAIAHIENGAGPLLQVPAKIFRAAHGRLQRLCRHACGAARLEHAPHRAGRIGRFGERLAVRHLQCQAVALCQACRQLGHGAAQGVQLALQLGADGEQQPALAGRHAEGPRAHVNLNNRGQHHAPVPGRLCEARQGAHQLADGGGGVAAQLGRAGVRGRAREVQRHAGGGAVHGALAQKHRALGKPRHVVEGVHLFYIRLLQQGGAHSAALARLFRVLKNKVNVARRALGTHAAGQGRQGSRMAVVPALVRHARAARGIGQAVFLLNGQRVEPCPAVCDGKRRVRLQKLLQHALCARLAARKLGRGVQRMAQRHCLFIQCVIQSQASPCLAAAAGPPASILAHGGRFEKPHGQKAPRAGCAGRASPPAQKSGRAPAGPCRRYVRTGKFCFALLAYLPK